MSKYQIYSEYKNSGVKWLGITPQTWGIKRLKYLCSIQTGFKDTVDAIDNGKYPFFVRSQTVERINSVGADCEAVLTAGDGVGVGKVYHYYKGKFDFHQRVYMLNKFDSLMGKFVFYYLSSNFSKVALEGNAKSTVDSLRLPQFLNFEFCVPPIKEQINITNFLDHETAKIDTLIDKQQQLIKLLKEKRQAVISHAVTKGLNPDVPMKDSGVEWLGEVPEHWDVVSIKHIVSVPVTDGPHETPKFLDNGVPFISAEAVSSGIINFDKIRAHISEEDNKRFSLKYSPEMYDIYMVKSGATTGITAIVETDQKFNIWSPLAVIRCKKDSYPYFILNFLRSFNFQKAVELNWSFGTQQNIGMGVIENLHVTRPPIEEAKEIADYVSEKCSIYDSLIDKAASQIELMKERRTALISAAVTGKIDVRNVTLKEKKTTTKQSEVTLETNA